MSACAWQKVYGSRERFWREDLRTMQLEEKALLSPYYNNVCNCWNKIPWIQHLKNSKDLSWVYVCALTCGSETKWFFEFSLSHREDWSRQVVVCRGGKKRARCCSRDGLINSNQIPISLVTKLYPFAELKLGCCMKRQLFVQIPIYSGSVIADPILILSFISLSFFRVPWGNASELGTSSGVWAPAQSPLLPWAPQQELQLEGLSLRLWCCSRTWASPQLPSHEQPSAFPATADNELSCHWPRWLPCVPPGLLFATRSQAVSARGERGVGPGHQLPQQQMVEGGTY